MKPFYFSLGALGSMSLDNALDIIKEAKFKEHLLGDISISKLQLCPQQHGCIDETVICKLLTEFSNIEFRFHANVNILGRREIVDICDFKNRQDYFQRLSVLNQLLKCPVYTAHAGKRDNCSFDEVIENTLELEQLFGVPVGIEGHYPSIRNNWLINSWDEYKQLLLTKAKYVIDLSHLNIVYSDSEVYERELVRELVNNPNCIEVHVSANNGVSDQHRRLQSKPIWWEDLPYVNLNCDIFTEGSLRTDYL